MGDGLRLVVSAWLLILLALAVVMTVADPNEYRLVRDLMTGYDKRIRPSLNHTDSLNVTFGLALVQIIDVDEKNQILTTNCWLNQIWTDYNLRWDPAKYAHIKVIRLPYDQVWRPDILLHNNADASSVISSISSNLVVDHNGNVTWYSMVIFKSSCSINVRYFPFDAQNCTMHFASWSYDGFKLNLLMNSEKGDISNYIPNSEWELIYLIVERTVRIFSCCDEPYPDIHFYIVIKRRPLFYIFNMILPCIMITLVALLGFYIPSDSGEKVTMGITTLLSMTVFMMLITDKMPPTSDVLPLIGIYYGMTIFIVSFATAMTVFTLNIHHKGNQGHPVPPLIKKICFETLAKVFCVRVDSYHAINSTYIPPDCNGMPSSNYVRYRLANQEEPDQLNMEMKQAQTDLTQLRVDVPLVPADTESLQSNGAIPRSFQSLRRSPTGNQNGNGNGNDSSSTSHTQTQDPQAMTPFESHFSRVLQRVYQTIEKNDIRIADQDKRDEMKLEWQQVAQITDRLLLTCFVMVTLTITGVVLFASPASVDV